MVRQTSIETYNEIKNNGLLSDLRFIAYDIVFQYGPATATELVTIIKNKNPRGSYAFIDSIPKRLSELRKCGVVYEVRERQCKVTGRTAIEWDVTGRLPVKFDKPKKIKCEHCDGKGYFIEQQSRLF